jgi:hypothetical protein
MIRRVVRRISVSLSATGVLLAGVLAWGCGAESQPPKPAASSAPAPESAPASGKKAAKGRNLGPQPGSADYADKPGRGPRGK